VSPTKRVHLLLIDAGNSAVKFQCHRLLLASNAFAPSMADTLISNALTTPVMRVENSEVSPERLLRDWQTAFDVLNRSEALAADTSMALAAEESIRWQLCWLSVGPVGVQASIRDAFQALAGERAPPAIEPAPEIRLDGVGRGGLLRNGYARPTQLGADRWASAVGWASAYSMDAPGIHMIVSAGTATTLDLVRADVVAGGTREFLGGWILPGVRLMNESLRSGTRDLDFAVDDAIGIGDIPQQTQDAITRGIGLGQAGFVGGIVDAHSVRKIWIHGGFGPWWQAAAEACDRSDGLKHKITAAPQILFAGLMAIAIRDRLLAPER
jgi:pantothenate kinase type III